MKAVERNGEVRIRETPRAAKIRMAEANALRYLDGMTVTKAELMKTYEMTHREATELVNLMVGAGTMVDKGRGLTWDNQYEVQKPVPQAAPYRAPETATERAHRLKMEKLYARYGRGKCSRCGGVMPGKGQHARARRGHTQAICDLQMVRLIQES